MTDTILYRREGHVGRLTINVPERHNSLGREQLLAMQEHLYAVAADRQVRVLILTGAGEKTFCAGASLQELGSGEIGADCFRATTAQLVGLAIPTVCALNGNVFGAGVELALSCDFRLGVEGSRMRVPAAAIGICYPSSGVQRLVQALGVNVARRMLLAAEEFDARAMLEIGFLDYLVLPGKFTDSTDELAHKIGGLAPLAVRSMKNILGQVLNASVDEEQVRELVDICARSEDFREGLAAQREKRQPRFSGA
ncbi:MAG: enoyl-CoA hydratase-related protein [Gammaproteobacteria bacterium]|nr:enoyl-CoA hydratase-related protein [Gammaproteobacteria bacterium]MDH5172063.1 enoyl-CoA hydratase-related protein [Gammaproteobacteria bacterium]